MNNVKHLYHTIMCDDTTTNRELLKHIITLTRYFEKRLTKQEKK